MAITVKSLAGLVSSHAHFLATKDTTHKEAPFTTGTVKV